MGRGVHVVPTRRQMMVSSIHVTDLCHALIAVMLHGARFTPGCDARAGLYYAAADECLSYEDLREADWSCHWRLA